MNSLGYQPVGVHSRSSSNLHPVLKLLIMLIIILSFIIFYNELSYMNYGEIVKETKLEIDEQFECKVNCSLQNWEQLIDVSSIQIGELGSNGNSKMKRLGLHKSIVLGSKEDELGIGSSKQYRIFSESCLQLFPHTVLIPFHSEFMNSNLPLAREFIKREAEMIWYIHYNMLAETPEYYKNDEEIELSVRLAYKSEDIKLKGIEYHYVDKKYGIGSIGEELNICLVGVGSNSYEGYKFMRFFGSIEKQNYTNYEVVLVDDGSSDKSADKFYEYLSASKMKLKNKIKILKIQDRKGTLASKYIAVRKYCRSDSIVVELDMDYSLIGNQVFKIINSMFRNSSVWMLYSRYLLIERENLQPLKTTTREFQTKGYRHAEEWIDLGLVSYRAELMSKIPLTHFLEYKFNEKENKYEPFFHTEASDHYLIYCLIELSGEKHVKYISDVLKFEEIDNWMMERRGRVKGQGCWELGDEVGKLKSKIKSVFKNLEKLSDFAEKEDIEVPIYFWWRLWFKRWRYERCVNSQKHSDLSRSKIVNALQKVSN